MRCLYTHYLLTRYFHGVTFSFVYFTCKRMLRLWILIAVWCTNILSFLFQDVACVFVHVCMCRLYRVIANPPSPIHTDFLLVQCTLHWLISILHSQLARSNPISCPARLINQLLALYTSTQLRLETDSG
jgi:hypothetical protein